MLLPWRDVPVGDGTINTSLTDTEADALVELARGRNVLEIGSAYGYSAVRMAQTAQSVLAVDPHTGHNSLQEMQTNLERYTDGNVSILLAPSRQALTLLRQIGAYFGLVFIDGDHSEAGVRHDVLDAKDLLAWGAAIACHDYHEDTCPGVATALDALYQSTKVVDTLWIL